MHEEHLKNCMTAAALLRSICSSKQHARSFALPLLLLMGIASSFLGLYIWSSDSVPLKLALPHQHAATRFVLVTALYDIHREDRSFEASYLPWFRRTMQKMSAAASHAVVFCSERRVADAARSVGGHHLVVTVLEDRYPLSSLVGRVEPIILLAGKRGNRSPEWTNKDYILLQFSKFRWMQHAMQLFKDEEEENDSAMMFFWVDAGISRFLLLGQDAMKFPLLISPGRISVQTIFPTRESFANASSSLGECMGCQKNIFKAGIFGGARKDVLWLSERMLHILEHDFIAKGVMDNEQAGLALLYSRFPERFNILFESDFVGEQSWWGCNFICI